MSISEGQVIDTANTQEEEAKQGKLHCPLSSPLDRTKNHNEIYFLRAFVSYGCHMLTVIRMMLPRMIEYGGD